MVLTSVKSRVIILKRFNDTTIIDLAQCGAKVCKNKNLDVP
jgi:hypothetical protein